MCRCACVFLARMCVSVCSLWDVSLCSVSVSVVCVGVCCSLTHRCVHVSVCEQRRCAQRLYVCVVGGEVILSLSELPYVVSFLTQYPAKSQSKHLI